MHPTHFTAISPLDGRYADTVKALAPLVSEFGLMRYRVQVECEWIIALKAPRNSDGIRGIYQDFSIQDMEHIKTLERTLRHDVKAVEYFIKAKLSTLHLEDLKEWVHFACTSEDINNLSYSLMQKEVTEKHLVPALETIHAALVELAKQYADLPMLARTHGQSATPTTLGKECANVAHRLERQLQRLRDLRFLGKINGASGNFNAHVVAMPQENWLFKAKHFVESLGLEYNPYTTQIEPHDGLAEWCHTLMRIHTILIDWARDVWGYVMLGYFKQNTHPGEIGSSTMPHKVNPIDFENAEGNLGMANALLSFFAEKLPISRFQRDLSDSTVLRNIGSAAGYALLAYSSLLKGHGRIVPDEGAIIADLNQHPEVISEAIQTVLRTLNHAAPYEALKDLTRGNAISLEAIHAFINELSIPEPTKLRLLALTPENYIGLAKELAENL